MTEARPAGAVLVLTNPSNKHALWLSSQSECVLLLSLLAELCMADQNLDLLKFCLLVCRQNRGVTGDPRGKRVRKSSSTAHVVLARLRKIVLLQKDCVPSELKITCLYLLVEVFIKAMNVLVVSLEVSSVLS